MSLREIVPPQTISDWRALWPEDNTTDRTTQTQEFASASKFTLENFLSLRVLRNETKIATFDGTRFGLDQKLIDEANRMLDKYNSRKTYCDSFKDGKQQGGSKRREGNFFLAKLYQENAAKAQTEEITESIISSPANHTRSREQRKAIMLEQGQSPIRPAAGAEASKPLPTRSMGGKRPLALRLKEAKEQPSEPDMPPETPSPIESVHSKWESPESPAWTPDETFVKSIDEQIVNTALVIFLNAITEHFQLPQHWTMHRKAFEANATRETKKVKLYEARTDGYLSNEKTQRVRALIEVKAAKRRSRTLGIFMQESAQMVAWIMHHPNEPLDRIGRRFQVLQDRDEIYLNFARYESKYLSYVKGEGTFEETDPESFMTIFEVGPYNTNSAAHMKRLVPILLALTLRAIEDEKEEIPSKGKGKGK